jgi:hypothetical protein
MATRKGPTKGGRILVKLPFGTNRAPAGKIKGVSTLVKVKEGVAELLGFQPLKDIPQKNVTIKTAAGSRTFKRVQNLGSFRRASVKLILAKPTPIKGSTGTFKTVSLPLGSGCTVSEAAKWLQDNKSKLCIGIITPDGNRIQWGQAA